jgi:hypothetical protein
MLLLWCFEYTDTPREEQGEMMLLKQVQHIEEPIRAMITITWACPVCGRHCQRSISWKPGTSNISQGGMPHERPGTSVLCSERVVIGIEVSGLPSSPLPNTLSACTSLRVSSIPFSKKRMARHRAHS